MTPGESTAGEPTAGDPPLRIGNDERTAAMKALDAHLAAGRLGVEEYADRSAIAANATVAPELTALFTDLPAPHPQLPGAAPATVVLPTAPLPVVPEPGALAQRRNFLNGWGPRIIAVTPFVALVLFFATGNTWQWFLLIPVVAVLVGGGMGGDSARTERRRERRGRS